MANQMPRWHGQDCGGDVDARSRCDVHRAQEILSPVVEFTVTSYHVSSLSETPRSAAPRISLIESGRAQGASRLLHVRNRVRQTTEIDALAGSRAFAQTTGNANRIGLKRYATRPVPKTSKECILSTLKRSPNPDRVRRRGGGAGMKRKSVFFLGAACFALLVVTGVGLLTGGEIVLAQGAAPTYRVAPLWPAPFPDDSWVLGSVSGVTVDAQNRVLVVHRGNDSLEGNEKGMIPAVGRGGVPGVPSSSVCCMSAPVVLEYDAAGKFLN